MLILGDKYCRNLQFCLKNVLGSNVDYYSTTSICKPGGPMQNIIENIELLAKNFTFRDHIIISGGSNNFNNNKTPSLKFLLTKLKGCLHTNIIILLILLQKHHTF